MLVLILLQTLIIIQVVELTSPVSMKFSPLTLMLTAVLTSVQLGVTEWRMACENIKKGADDFWETQPE